MNGEWDYVFHLTLDEAVVCFAVIIALVIASGFLGWVAGRWSRASEVAHMGRLLDEANRAALELYRKEGPKTIR